MNAPLPLGLHRGIAAATYHTDPGSVSNTMLSAMNKSPAHCYALHLAPNRPIVEQTPAMFAGSFTHTAILEPAALSSRPQGQSQPVAEWHGVVVSVGSDHFVAELYGKSGDGVAGTHEEATLPVDEVSQDDRELLRPGSFFRLCVSRETDRAGALRRTTYIVFRRMPAYRNDELRDAATAARDLMRDLGLD